MVITGGYLQSGTGRIALRDVMAVAQLLVMAVPHDIVARLHHHPLADLRMPLMGT